MRRTFVCACLLSALCAAARVEGTVYVPADLATLAAEARAIAYGRVVAIESRWVDDAVRRAIETLVTLEVAEYAKGNLGQTVTLRVPGGQLGPYKSLMIGAPRFSEGEEVVLFLAAEGPAIPHLLALGQGVYRVRLSAATGMRMVTPEIVRLAGAEPAAGQRVVRGDAARRPAPLQAFMQEVRALAGRAR